MMTELKLSELQNSTPQISYDSVDKYMECVKSRDETIKVQN